MADSTETYRRMPSTVPGTLLRWSQLSSAWLAADHVLLTGRVLWVERYNRLYFSDIQAVTICRTQTGLVWNILLGAAAGLLALAGLLNGFPQALLVWLAIFTIPLIANIALGPTCSCHAYTAVNDHRLPCFNRWSKAIVFLRTIRPLIEEVQGVVSDDEIVERAPLIPPVRRTAPGAPAPGKIRHYAGQVHMALIVLLFCGAVVSSLQLVAQAALVGWITAALLVAQFGMSIAAAARQAGTDIPGGLRKVVWLSFAHTLVMPVMFAVASVVMLEEMSRNWDDNTSIASTVASIDIMYFMINLLSAFYLFTLGFIGRHQLVVFRDRYRLRRMASATRVRTLGAQET